MRTRNVNGKTAGGETAGRCDQNTQEVIALQAKALIARYRRLQDGVTVFTARASSRGDVQVEIRQFGRLVWHAWSFEPEFLATLENRLRDVQRNHD
ncbi:hypothetical protein [Kosakonia sp. 1610]|jgi:hypothetical protein|uniref:hypothetical protein n=1 Tax=Kosakonia sp. 1610 TaxID=3156426 RepID=UPI003D1CFCFA